MKIMNRNLLSNAEIKIQLKEMEDEYEALKTKIKRNLERMDVLDKKYLQLKEILTKRTKGFI